MRERYSFCYLGLLSSFIHQHLLTASRINRFVISSEIQAQSSCTTKAQLATFVMIVHGLRNPLCFYWLVFHLKHFSNISGPRCLTYIITYRTRTMHIRIIRLRITQRSRNRRPRKSTELTPNMSDSVRNIWGYMLQSNVRPWRSELTATPSCSGSE